MPKRNVITIWCVDPDEQLCLSIKEVLSKYYEVKCFSDIKHCLSTMYDSSRGVLIIDVALLNEPRMDNLFNLCRIGSTIQVIATGANVCIAQLVKLIKQGLYDFIPKPLIVSDVIKSILTAVNTPNVQFKLTVSEEKVLALVLEGKVNKEIARLLERSVRTIEVHRYHINRKLGARNKTILIQLGIEYFSAKMNVPRIPLLVNPEIPSDTQSIPKQEW